MRGTIGIENLQIHCIIGNNPEERIFKQPLLVDLKVKVDFSRCAATDHIDDTVDYDRVTRICIELAAGRHYRLLETLACEVVNKLLSELPIDWAWIYIKKPRGNPFAQYTFVEYEQQKSK